MKIGFIGRISPEKNLLNLVKAIKIMRDKSSSVRLEVYGDARNKNYLDEIKTFIDENQLNEIITMNGKSSEIQEVYKNF